MKKFYSPKTLLKLAGGGMHTPPPLDSPLSVRPAAATFFPNAALRTNNLLILAPARLN